MRYAAVFGALIFTAMMGLFTMSPHDAAAKGPNPGPPRANNFLTYYHDRMIIQPGGNVGGVYAAVQQERLG